MQSLVEMDLADLRQILGADQPTYRLRQAYAGVLPLSCVSLSTDILLGGGASRRSDPPPRARFAAREAFVPVFRWNPPVSARVGGWQDGRNRFNAGRRS